MPDDGAVGVAEAPIVEEVAAEAEAPAETSENEGSERLDGRKQPDALKKHIADLRRRAETITDPAEKKAELERIKFLYDSSGKTRAYEQHFPTVREAREVKSLVESFGGREGLVELQSTLSTIQEIDQQLESGDPRAAEKMWEEAPEGMAKLAPAIFARLEQANPQAYAEAIIPHAIKFFESNRFPEAFDQMVQYYREGEQEKGNALAAKLADWFNKNREATQEQKANPEVERLQRELEERKSRESAAETNRAYEEVIAHARPIIDRHLRPIATKLGLSRDQYDLLREDIWRYLQETRNADPTYKTIANAKYREGLSAAVRYMKSETEARAQDAVRARVNQWYRHQLKNDAAITRHATQSPVVPGVMRGKEPTPAEIDYSPKGIAVAKKSGFKDLGDMILAGKAPLKSGGIRQWK